MGSAGLGVSVVWTCALREKRQYVALAMNGLACETCGGRLRLSLIDDAYLCEDAPKEHMHPRAASEERWIGAARTRVSDSPDDVEAVFGLANVFGQLAVLTFGAADGDRGRGLLNKALAVLDKLMQERV